MPSTDTITSAEYDSAVYLQEVSPNPGVAYSARLRFKLAPDGFEVSAKSHHNGEIVTVHSGDYGNSAGRMFLAIIAALHRFESDAEWDRETAYKADD